MTICSLKFTENLLSSVPFVMFVPSKSVYCLISEARSTASSCLLAGGDGFWLAAFGQPKELGAGNAKRSPKDLQQQAGWTYCLQVQYTMAGLTLKVTKGINLKSGSLTVMGENSPLLSCLQIEFVNWTS